MSEPDKKKVPDHFDRHPAKIREWNSGFDQADAPEYLKSLPAERRAELEADWHG